MIKTTPAGLPLLASLSNFELMPRLTWVEVNSFFQVPGLSIIGLPSQEILEARERIRSAIEAQGFEMPKRRVIIHLSPAHIPKQGTGYDLAMALGVLAAHQESIQPTHPTFAWGELGLDGRVRDSTHPLRAIYAAMRASIPVVILSVNARNQAQHALQTLEAALAQGELRDPLPLVYCVSNLAEAKQILEGNPPPELLVRVDRETAVQAQSRASLKLLSPSPLVQKALELAAGGEHHLLLLGPKGTGKSYAFEWLREICPSPSSLAQLEHRIATELVSTSPQITPLSQMDSDRRDLFIHSNLKTVFRMISTQVRPAALLGSLRAGCIIPGEFTLADRGWLIADEFLEWHRDARECLRGPLEQGQVLITRAGRSSVELPARFCLAASANTCPCGGYPPEVVAPHHHMQCKCSELDRRQYQSRLSGPILDRIDLLVRTGLDHGQAFTPAAVSPGQAGLPNNGINQSLDASKERVLRLRDRARARLGASFSSQSHDTQQSGPLYNGFQSGAPIGKLAPHELEDLFSKGLPQWEPHLPGSEMSLRGRHKTMRILLTLLCHPSTPDSAWRVPSRALALEARSFRPEGIS